MNAPIRLQVYLARAGVASRRSSELLISQGRVHVNGICVRTLGVRVRPGTDRVSLDGKPLDFENRVLFLFHKPRGVVTTLKDKHAKRTITDFLSGIDERVFPVGRLDADVSGLLLLTNDGELAEKLLHPRYRTTRVYVARVRGRAEKALVQRLKNGVKMEDGEKKSARCRILETENDLVQLLGPLGKNETFLEVAVHEGEKHFVKRLLKAAGHPVVRLSRTAFGPYSLGTLEPGKLIPASIAQASSES